MRTFLFVMFGSSVLGVFVGICVLASVTTWPHKITWSRTEWALKLMCTIAFMFWEAWLLWGAR